MTLEGVPWFIHGATHGPEVARLLSHLATGGNDGVVGPNDFKVIASPIPDGNVRIQPGAVGFNSPYAGAQSQSYLVRNVGQEVKAIAAQGSSGPRYDLVCVITKDRNFAGEPQPASIPNGPYNFIEVYANVPASTTRLSEVDADACGYALARVAMGASDGTVEQASITDLRELIQPRTKEELRIFNAAANVNLPTAAGTAAPPEADVNLYIPPWANKVILEADWAGVYFTDTASGTGSSTGGARVTLGSLATNDSQWRVDAVGASKPITLTHFAGQELAIPLALRGTTQNLQAELYRSTLVAMTAITNSGTVCRVRARFMEVPE